MAGRDWYGDPVKLTIYIPTYDRPADLKRLLDAVCPQLVDGVELIVSDNHGSARDLVAQYDGVRYVKRWTDIGCDGNCLSGVFAGTGEYVWVIGDDDKPMAGAVDYILRHIDGIDRLILTSSVAGETPVGFFGTMRDLWNLLSDKSFIVASTLCSMNVWRRSVMNVGEGVKHLDSRNVLAWTGLGCWSVRVASVPLMSVGREHQVTFAGFGETMAAYTDALADAIGVDRLPFQNFGRWNYTNAKAR